MSTNPISNRKINIKALKIFYSMTGKDNYLLLNTSYGFITGSLSELDDKIVDKIVDGENFNSIISSLSLDNKNLDLSVLRAIQSDMIKDFKSIDENFKIIPNNGMIFLEDVRIFKDDLKNPVLSINTFALYLDSILGFSLIPKDFLNQD